MLPFISSYGLETVFNTVSMLVDDMSGIKNRYIIPPIYTYIFDIYILIKI